MLENIEKDDIRKLLVKGNDQNLDIDLIVQCFFAIVLDRLLLPRTKFYLGSGTLEAVTALEKLKTVGWSYLIFEELKTSVEEFAENQEKIILGCTAVLMVSTNGHHF
jgi:hypothetical protein